MSQKYQISSLIFTVCFALITGTAAANSEVSVEGEYWNPKVSGNTTAATSLDFKNDLGLKKSNIIDLKLSFKEDKGLKYFIKHEAPSFKETVNLNRSFQFNGSNYAAGDKVTSNVDVKHFQFGVQNEKLTPGGKFSITYSYNHNSVNTSVQNVTKNFSSNKEGTSDCLSIGLGWETLNKKGVNYFAEVTPLSIGSRGSYLDYNFGIKTKIGKALTLTVGYKGERIKAGSDNTSIHLNGMYIFLGSGF